MKGVEPESLVALPHPDSLGMSPGAGSGDSAGAELMRGMVMRDGLLPVEHTVHEDRQWHFVIALPPEVEVVPQPAIAPTLDDPTQSLGLFRRSAPDADFEVLGHLLEYDVDRSAETLSLVWANDSGRRADTNGQAWRLDNGNSLHIVGSAGVLREVDAAGDDVWRVDFERNLLLGQGEYIEDLYTLVSPEQR